jgi:hypothetical protein
LLRRQGRRAEGGQQQNKSYAVFHKVWFAVIQAQSIQGIDLKGTQREIRKGRFRGARPQGLSLRLDKSKAKIAFGKGWGVKRRLNCRWGKLPNQFAEKNRRRVCIPAKKTYLCVRFGKNHARRSESGAPQGH